MDKANIFYPVFAVIIVIIAGIFSYSFLTNIENSSKAVVGKPSLELIHTYESAEKAKFYLYESAKIAAWQSIEEISKDFSRFGAEFSEVFNKNLNNNLKQYNEAIFLQDNYDYAIDTATNLKITGKAKQQLEIIDSNDISIKYSFEPDFEVELPYRINYYLNLAEGLKSCIKGQVDEQCLSSLKEKNNFNYWIDESNKNLINFEIPAESNTYTNKLITIKFNRKINPLLS